jgi:hypothetical protein
MAVLMTLAAFPAIPACAQTVIGGGTCNSATLTGAYELVLSGRQLTSTGAVTQVFQGVGTATFDGLSKVTIALTSNTVTTTQSFGTAVTYAGTYSLQSNCIGTISITSGDTATYTLEAYTQPGSAIVATGFAIIGSDASYAFNGTGTAQPATCPTTITGAHEFSATGSGLSGASVTSTVDMAGVLQFDGAGNITAAWTQASNLTATKVSATGTYTVGTNCLASAIFTDTSNNKYTLNLSFTSTSPAFGLAGTSPTMIFDGSGSAMQSASVAACSTSSLSGSYYMTLAGRLSPGGVASKILSSVGTATFDGAGHVTFNLTASSVNGSQVFGAPLTYSGAYTIPASCQGSISLTTGDTASLTLVAYNFDTTTLLAKNFVFVGTDATYAINGSGSLQPSVCANSTLSGAWAFSGTGNSLSGTTNTGLDDLAGVMQFDGQGNVTASWNQATNSATTSFSATGTYTVTAGCTGTFSLTDTSSNTYSAAISVYGVDEYGFPNDYQFVMTTPQLIFTGTGRSTFVNPGEAVDNNSDFGPGATPAGSVFSLFGSGLSTKTSQPTTVPLPTTVLSTTLSVNGLRVVRPTGGANARGHQAGPGDGDRQEWHIHQQCRGRIHPHREP